MTNLGFDTETFLKQTKRCLEEKLSKGQKMYLEIEGDLLGNDMLNSVLPEYGKETMKLFFSGFKSDMEILICVKAQDIINNIPMGEQQKPLREFLPIYLKRIENQYGIKPHIVINNIDVENMYDLIFSFETNFQKLTYRVWERYKIKGYPHNVEHLLSEDGFGNDDHIPLMKKLVLVAGLTSDCGKLSTCLGQIYLDNEIDIPAQYAKFKLLPFADFSLDHPLNIAWQASVLESGDQLVTLAEEDGKEKTLNEKEIQTRETLFKVLSKISGLSALVQQDTNIATLGGTLQDEQQLCIRSLKFLEEMKELYTTEGKATYVEEVEKLQEKAQHYCEEKGLV